MCGRYLLASPAEEVAKFFRVTGPNANTRARYNIAPTQDALAILCEKPGIPRVFAILRWGLIPAWAKDRTIGAKLINARAETVASNPSFRDAFRLRRCVIPADGFYEWSRDADHTPHAIMMKDRRPMGFAGLWERWTDRASGEVVRTCTIITTAANTLCAPLHDRMPVILEPEDFARWLGEPSTPDEEASSGHGLETLLRPYRSDAMMEFPVDRRVGNVKNDDAGLIEPADPSLRGLL